MAINTKIRAVGNSKGVILPKKYLDECGIKHDIEITMKDNMIIIKASRKEVKKKWTDFKRVNKREVSKVERVKSLPNKFDESDWTW